jgi:hypothetical protein
MTAFPVAPPVEVYPPNPGSVEARASLGLKVLGVIHLAGVVLALIPVPVSTLYTVSFHAAGGALAILCLITARAIDRRRPWAVAIVRPLLVVLAASGVAVVALAVQEGGFRLPVDGIVAVLALIGRPDVALVRRFDLRSGAALGGVALAIAVMLFGHPVFDWGGALDQHEPDLRATLSVECGPAGGGLPASIPIRYDWSWATPGLLPSGLDEVVLGWSGDDPAGRPLYLVGAIPENAKGIYPGRLGEPSIDMATAVKAESDGSWQWAIELGERQLAAGQVEVGLDQASHIVPPGGARLVVKATYVHLGIWRSDEIATCTW